MKRWALSVVTLLISAAHGQVFTWTNSGDKIGDKDFASMVWAKSFSVADMVSAANQLAARPAGMRCLFLWCDTHAIFLDKRDWINAQYQPLWWPKATADSLAHNNALISQLKAAKVVPDVVVLDDEGQPCTYNLSIANISAIAADPRGAALGVVPLVPGDEAGALRFNDIALTASNVALWKGILSPFHTYAPNAALSQFGSSIVTPAEGQIVHEHNDHAAYMNSMLGTVASPAVYGGSGLNPLTQQPYTDAIYLENLLRLAASRNAVWPWYGAEAMDPKWAGTGYWGELVRHGLLTCGLRGLLFEPDQPSATKQFAGVYNEAKKIVGGKMPTTLCSSDIIDPKASFYVTARADNWTGGGSVPTRIVGRVTFAPGVRTATFSVANQTFTVTPTAGQPGAWFTYGTASATQTSTAPAPKAAPAKTVTPPSSRVPHLDPIRPIIGR